MSGGRHGHLQAIPETTCALARLSTYDDEAVAATFEGLVHEVEEVAPGCVGVTVTYLHDGLAFTWLASDIEAAVLDGVQYVDGGPCEEGVAVGERTEAATGDLFSEGRWLLHARATAAAGVGCTLSLPVLDDGGAVRVSFNLYGDTPTAFAGRVDGLARVVGGWADGAVTNADLGLSGVQMARATPGVIDDRMMRDKAVGMIMAAQRVDSDTASHRLSDAADRAGIDVTLLAHVIVKGRLLG